jgi:hypothetical protein
MNDELRGMLNALLCDAMIMTSKRIRGPVSSNVIAGYIDNWIASEEIPTTIINYVKIHEKDLEHGKRYLASDGVDVVELEWDGNNASWVDDSSTYFNFIWVADKPNPPSLKTKIIK